MHGQTTVRTLALLVCLGLALPALSLEPPTAAEIELYKRDGTFAQRLANALALGNHVVDPLLVQSLRTRLRTSWQVPGETPAGLALPSGRRGGLPAKGSVKVFALLIDFADYPAVNGVPTITSKLFEDGDTGYPYESLRNYYRRASYNMLEIGGSVLGWYRPAYTRASMPMTPAARESLIKEALTHFDAQGHDFSRYDNDGNGAIDYFIVVWAGPSNGWGNFWWGYQTTFSDQSFQLDGKLFYYAKYSWQWESRYWPGAYDQVVVMHETGHALGLPDYYDYEAGGRAAGRAGRAGHDGRQPRRPQRLQQDAPGLDRPAGLRLRDARLRPGRLGRLAGRPHPDAGVPLEPAFRRVLYSPEPVPDGQRYAAWQATGCSSGMSTPGSTRAGRTSATTTPTTEHKLLRLMEADGQEMIERGYSYGASDYYTAGRGSPPPRCRPACATTAPRRGSRSTPSERRGPS